MNLNKRMAVTAFAGALTVMLWSFGQANLSHAASPQASPMSDSVDAYSSSGVGIQQTATFDVKDGNQGNTTLAIADWDLPATPPSAGTGTVTQGTGSNSNVLYYTPPPDFSGTVTFTYTLHENGNSGQGAGVNAPGIITVMVYPVLIHAAVPIDITDGNATTVSLSQFIAGSPGVTVQCDGASTAGGQDASAGSKALSYTPPIGPAITSDNLENCTVTDTSDAHNHLVSSPAVTVDLDITWYWTVNFQSNGGSPVTTQSIEDGYTASQPADPTRTNYTFDGWAADPADCDTPMPAGTRFDFPNTRIINGPNTLFACWLLNPSQQNPTGSTNSSDTVSGDLRNVNNATNGYSNEYPGPGYSGSWVRVVCSTSSLTGGCAALSDGHDTKLLQATLGGNQTGSTSGYSISSSPGGVQLSFVTRNSDGSFLIGLTSDTPGIYQVSVRYNGVTIGTVTVNFIDGVVSDQTITTGNTQVLTGQGFWPGELVTISVHSDPIQVARLAADANGTVQATFVIPNGFGFGSHTAIFTGDRSGTATAAFTVTLAASTGGTVDTSPALAGVLMMAGLAAGSVMVRRRSTQIS